MDFKIIWSPRGVETLRELVEYIARDNPTAARRMGEVVLEKTLLLGRHPGLGKSFAKLNPNGTLASPNPAFNGTVYSLALDSSGNIYAGGAFTYVNDQPRRNLAKINPDGTLNPFNVLLSENSDVRAIKAGASGNLFIGGTFYSVDGIVRQGFAKFNPNGTLNTMYQLGNPVGAILVDGVKLHVSGGRRNYQIYTNGDSNCDLLLTNPTPASRCGTGTVTLSITPSSGTVNWYDAPQNGNLIGTGATFVTPTISATTTYYAQAVDGGCLSFSRTRHCCGSGGYVASPWADLKTRNRPRTHQRCAA